MVSLARCFLDDPHWGWHAAKALGADVARPLQYAARRPEAVGAGRGEGVSGRHETSSSSPSCLPRSVTPAGTR